jgi:hypothetical protein
VEREFYVYLHCRPDGSPFYVGKCTVDPKRRNKRFLMLSHRNPLHQNIVNKHGKDNIGRFAFRCESEREALDSEVQMIAQLRADGYQLANLTDGGEGMSGFKASPETLAKLSAVRKGRKASDETRAKLSETLRNRQHKPWTQGQREKYTASRKGVPTKPFTEEHKAKIAAAHKGKIQGPASEATKLKMSEAQKKRQSSPEARAAQSLSMRIWWQERKLAKENNFAI